MKDQGPQREQSTESNQEAHLGIEDLSLEDEREIIQEERDRRKTSTLGDAVLRETRIKGRSPRDQEAEVTENKEKEARTESMTKLREMAYKMGFYLSQKTVSCKTRPKWRMQS